MMLETAVLEQMMDNLMDYIGPGNCEVNQCVGEII